MNDSIEHHLAVYIAKRRIVALLRSILWCCALAVAWLSLPKAFRFSGLIVGAVMMIGILARPVAQLFRRDNRVNAAIEIEARWPEFDQRLITVASEKTSAPLLDHLRQEVETILITHPTKIRVSLRPLITPLILLIVVAVALCIYRLKY